MQQADLIVPLPVIVDEEVVIQPHADSDGAEDLELHFVAFVEEADKELPEAWDQLLFGPNVLQLCLLVLDAQLVCCLLLEKKIPIILPVMMYWM